MILKGFLIAVAICMFFILLCSKLICGDREKTQNNSGVYFALIAVFMLLSYCTFLRYTKSDGKGNYYSNTDYHLFQEEGFKYHKGEVARLAHDEANTAILLSRTGELYLDDSVRLHTNDFEMPLYVGNANANDEVEMSVVNLTKEYALASGDSLLIMKGGNPLLFLKYEEFPHVKSIKDRFKNESKIPEYDSVMFVFSLKDGVYDTVIMPSFHKGYNLGNLLQKGSKTRLDANGFNFFSKCYLIRDRYKMDATHRNTSGKVYLFADNPAFNDSCQVHLNGTAFMWKVDNEVRNLDMNDKYFSLGLGDAKTPVYHVTQDNNNVFVNYRLPLMYHLPNEIEYRKGDSKIYLTTSKQEIVKLHGDYDIFYQFDEQLDDNSIYQASAVLNFRIDNAGVDINAEIADSETDGVIQSIVPGKQFEVKTKSCNGENGNLAQVSYLFNVKDMRKNEVYNGALCLYIIMLGLLLVIYILLWFINRDSDSQRMNKWFAIETSVYLALIAFLTVRLVILWRLHAFPPIDGVSYSEFNKLTDASNFTWTGIAIGSILFIRFLVLVCQWSQTTCRIGWLGRFTEKLSFDNFMEWLSDLEMPIVIRVIFIGLLPAVLYAICGLLLHVPQGEVFVKEALAPVLAFIINSAYFVYAVRNDRSTESKRICRWGIAMNTIWFLVFLYIPKSWPIGFGEQGMLVPMLAVMTLWIGISAWLSEHTEDDKSYGRIISVLAVVLVILGVFFHGEIIEKTDTGKWMLSKMPRSRIKARVETLVYTPTEMVENENVEFGDKTMQDILNAASNKWFIDNHLVEAKRIDNPSDFYLDKEYNQRAVSYLTQTRDVLLLRYIIYEHGKGVVWCLLIILAILTFTVICLYKWKDTNLPYLQMVPMQSALFLLFFSGFLYLVNNNAVVFVGLDFPFLSMASKIAPFGLLIPLFALLLPLRPERMDDCLEDDNEVSRTVIIGAAITLLFFISVGVPGSWANKKIEERVQAGQLQAETFSISMEPLAEFINNYLNPSFKKWQDENALEIKKSRNRNRNRNKIALKDMPITSDSLKTELNKVLFDMKLLDKNLKNYAKNITDPNHYSDTTFIKSAFIKFFNTSLTDTKNLIHIRHKKEYFIFVPNKVYYDMKPMFNNGLQKAWRGDLLAAETKSHIEFVESENVKWSIDKNVSSLKPFSKEGNKYHRYLTSSTNPNNLLGEIYQIPAKYCYDTTSDIFVVTANLTKQNTITVLPKGDASSSFTEALALRVLPNDRIDINGEAQFSFEHEDDHYFSMRIHYNGKHQVIYPLGNQFMFAYNFDKMLEDEYKTTESATTPVRISLDYNLLDSVNTFCKKEIPHDARYGDGIAVTAIDGNGRIRLLADFNPNKILTTNPNEEKEMQKKMEEIWLNGDDDAEKALLLNRNLDRMEMGPGSTIKVPFYVALLARLDHINWDTLCVNFPTGTDPEGNSLYQSVNAVKSGKTRDMVTHFGRDRVYGFHSLEKGGNRVQGWDEMQYEYSNPHGAPNGILGPSDFIATSNNFYFGSLLMLGAYGTKELNNGLEGVLEPTSREEAVFPKFVSGGHYYTFKKNLMEDVQRLDNGLDNFALEASLRNNFRFNTDRKKPSSLDYKDVEPVKSLFNNTAQTEWGNLNALYVHSIRPSLYRDINAQTDLDVFYDNNFQLTAGGALQLEVSPLNMAEMYLRIALQNGTANNLLTYNDGRVLPTASMPMANDSVRFGRTMQRTAFKGMYKVINQRKAGINGTLAWRYDKNGQRVYRVGQALTNEMQDKGIYLYGKTGTASAAGKDNDNYHYAFILSNRPLHSNNMDRADLKIYVVYFGYYNGSKDHVGSRNSRDKILHQIINSETFKEYWGLD